MKFSDNTNIHIYFLTITFFFENSAYFPTITQHFHHGICKNSKNYLFLKYHQTKLIHIQNNNKPHINHPHDVIMVCTKGIFAKR
eukprot:UN04102